MMSRLPKKRRRQSTFSDIDEFGYIASENNDRLNRADQVRRDDDIVQSFEITLETVDTAIIHFIENQIKPYVEENGARIPVPVMYASPEKWSSIQTHGFLRDNKGKLIIPLITIRRISMSPREALAKNEVAAKRDNKLTFRKNYSKQNKYDQFSVLQGRKPLDEIWEMNLPDFVDIEYEVICWTEYTYQVNKLAEMFIFWEGMAWGDTYKFITTGQSYNFETVNTEGVDRINKSTITLQTKAPLMPKDFGTQHNVRKGFTNAQIVIGETTINNINDIPTK